MVITSTYPVGEVSATETDAIDVATRLPVSVFISVPAISVHPAYTQHWAYHWLATAPPGPQVGAICS